MAVEVSITVTVPDEILNIPRVRRSIEDGLYNVTGPKLQAMFRKTVVGWEQRPAFIRRREFLVSQMAIVVHAGRSGAEKYALVNAGARPHIIRPKRGGFLRFRSGYRAATVPRVISSRAKVRSGQLVRRSVVHHPGFAAREFDQAIAEEHAPEFEADVRESINRAVR